LKSREPGTSRLKALTKRSEDRYQTATEMLKDLERVGKYNNVTV
jgi:hypothetical protein